jgi:4a-hydroxytetrahydrobiopterin dehydratase
MNNNVCLIDKSCVPCQGGVPPLDAIQTAKLLSELRTDWQINEAGHLYKQYIFDDFMGPINFANRIAALAEQEAHHPDLLISWGACAIEIWTHKINGLTESDFILAAKIEILI